MDRISVGVDVGADIVAICAVTPAGTTVGEVTCDAAPPTVIMSLREMLHDAPSIIGLEAGGCGTALVRKLRAAGFEVRVLEARYVSGFLQLTQNKTDRNDAQGIAEIVRLDAKTVPDVLVKAETIQMLRSELVLRHRLMTQRLALENALRGTFRLNGGRLRSVFSGTDLSAAVEEELARLRLDGVDLGELVQPVVALLVQLRRTLERSNRRLTYRANDLDACHRFMAIPGVGCICALSFYTAIADPHRFERSADVGPYLGLVPKISQSGTVFRSGRISRMGNTMTRTHLVSAAKSMMQQANKESDLRRWAMALAERSSRGKARVALARKLATVMLSMWKSGDEFRPTRLTG